MKLIIMVMSVTENTQGSPRISAVLGVTKDKEYDSLGSAQFNFEQFGYVHSLLKVAKSLNLIEYKHAKWDAYLNKLLEELANL